MEHRLNPRKETNSLIMLYQLRTGIIKASVKNISIEGMLVDTGRFWLAKGTTVELAGIAMQKLGSEMGSLKALIIFANEGLAGLMFIENMDLFSNITR